MAGASIDSRVDIGHVKVAVFGAGGVGGYFGGRLALAGAEVHLIARGDHLRALRDRGLRVRSLAGDFEARLPATDDPADVGPVDYVLFCVKSYDTESAAARLGPLLHEGTAVVSLQNGIDNEEKIAAAIGPEHVMGGAAFIFSTIAEPGVIAHTGGPRRIVFGELDGRRSDRVERLLRLCEEAGVGAPIADDIRVVLWDKFVLICGTAGITATTRLPLDEIRAAPESWEMFRRILQEVWLVGRAEGLALADDTVERHASFAESVEPGFRSSLHYDLVHGKRLELDALHGTVLRLAARHGIATPMCEAVYALLRPYALRAELATTLVS
jgi:2-dehydropantoate 2-reductase